MQNVTGKKYIYIRIINIVKNIGEWRLIYIEDLLHIVPSNEDKII
jgi:hypothetical protein